MLGILLFISFENLYGQGFQVGVRTGVNKWASLSARDGYTFNPAADNPENRNWGGRFTPNHSQNSEIFIRTEIKRWSFEQAVAYYSYKHHSAGFQLVFDSPSYYYDFESFSKYCDMISRVNYMVSYDKRWKDYIGITTIVQHAYTKTKETDFIDDAMNYGYSYNYDDKYEYRDGYHDLEFYFGINNSLSYKVADGLNLTSLIEVSYNPIGIWSYEYSYVKASICIGLSYQLK